MQCKFCGSLWVEPYGKAGYLCRNCLAKFGGGKLNKEDKKRVAELHQDRYSLEHSGKRGFCRKLIPLYQEMQTLYRKQEAQNEQNGE